MTLALPFSPMPKDQEDSAPEGPPLIVGSRKNSRNELNGGITIPFFQVDLRVLFISMGFFLPPEFLSYISMGKIERCFPWAFSMLTFIPCLTFQGRHQAGMGDSSQPYSFRHILMTCLFSYLVNIKQWYGTSIN